MSKEKNEKKKDDFIEKVSPKNIEDEMKHSYIDYAMSVIVGRALPDARDGLKPVHRRILFAMNELGLHYNKPYRKSATVVGDVLGKYHPHGDMAVYDSIVRMVQEFSLRNPLIDGQGNFGSVDGDSAAAYRYTEVRLSKIAEELLGQIDEGTVDFTPNFDGTREEPVVLPAAFPNLLVNGSSGIAVGMATNIPPHNLGEVIDGVCALIDSPETRNEDLLKIIKGPDFPTGGVILGRQGIKNAYTTGRGSVTIRAISEIEEIKANRSAIIVTELPYQVNKSLLLERIGELVKDKKMEGISDIRDESNKEGIRIVIELKKDANPQIVQNQLYKHTSMETSFGIILLAIVEGKPKVLTLRECLTVYIEHRKEVVLRRTKFRLRKAEERAHILEGLKIAIDNLNRIIKVIRESKDVETARLNLMNEFELSKIQAQAILDMKLHQLTALERNKLEEEYLELIKTIEKLRLIISDMKRVLKIVKDELLEIREKYANARKTRIGREADDIDIEDLIQEEDVVVSMTLSGYIKRSALDAYRTQNRGGRGASGMTTKEDDIVSDIFVSSTHAYLLLFTNLGRLYWLKVYEIPESSRAAKGKAVINLVKLTNPGEKITSCIPVREFKKGTFLLMVTKNGTIKKTAIEEYDSPRAGGVNAIRLDEGDLLTEVKLTDGKSEVIIATRNGLAIRFEEKDIRIIGRVGKGVRGVRLRPEDRVVGMEVVSEKDAFLVCSEKGYGKRTDVKEYRLISRGGKGVMNMKITDKNGPVIGLLKVEDKDELFIVTEKGITIRSGVRQIRETGRVAQGVRLIKLEEGDKVIAIARIPKEDKIIDEAVK